MMAVSCGTPTPATTRVVQIEDAFAVPVRGVDGDDVDADLYERGHAVEHVGRNAHGRPYAQPAMLVLAGVGVLAPLPNIFKRDEPLQVAVVVDHRQLLDVVLLQDLDRLVEGRSHRRRH